MQDRQDLPWRPYPTPLHFAQRKHGIPAGTQPARRKGLIPGIGSLFATFFSCALGGLSRDLSAVRTTGEKMICTMARVATPTEARGRIRRVTLTLPFGGSRFEHLASFMKGQEGLQCLKTYCKLLAFRLFFIVVMGSWWPLFAPCLLGCRGFL